MKVWKVISVKILVPVEEVVDIKNGRKTISERKFYPGYVLVEMEMTDDSWHLVKSTPRVSGFIGGTANKPTPISQREADAILQQVRTGVEKPKPKVETNITTKIVILTASSRAGQTTFLNSDHEFLK